MKKRPALLESAIDGDRLYVESTKIRCLAYLIENQRDTGVAPLELEEINQGLASILEEIAVYTRTVAINLDAIEARKTWKRKV